MAEGKSRQAWGVASCVLAMIANVNRDPKKTRALKPEDFNPYAARSRRGPGKGIPVRADNIHLLKGLVKAQKGKATR